MARPDEGGPATPSWQISSPVQVDTDSLVKFGQTLAQDTVQGFYANAMQKVVPALKTGEYAFGQDTRFYEAKRAQDYHNNSIAAAEELIGKAYVGLSALAAAAVNLAIEYRSLDGYNASITAAAVSSAFTVKAGEKGLAEQLVSKPAETTGDGAPAPATGDDPSASTELPPVTPQTQPPTTPTPIGETGLYVNPEDDVDKTGGH